MSQFWSPYREWSLYLGIERENKTCALCNQQEIGDEFHFIFKCHERHKYISNYYSSFPSILIVQALMCGDNRNTLLNLAKCLLKP
jgi:hypothetical protein